MPTRAHAVGTFGSLFSGCGGFDLGFVQAGFRPTAAFDIDATTVEVYRRNIDSHAFVRDLSQVEDAVRMLTGVEVLLAGPPCQGFSTAGRRRFSDPRNHLLLVAGQIAKAVKPRVFVAENVSGVVAGKHRAYWQSLHAMLRAAGYSTADLECDAQKMGVAQIRRRMVMLAWNNHRDIRIDLPTAGHLVLRDALARLDGAPNHEIRVLAPGSSLSRIAKHIKCGQKLCNVRGGPRSVHTWSIAEVFGATTEVERRTLLLLLRLRRRMRVRDFGDADPVPAKAVSSALGQPSKEILEGLMEKGYVRRVGSKYDLSHTFNGKFRRLEWDSPSATVDTRFVDPRYFLHPDEERGFTIREAARIQGFPDSFAFLGSERQQAKMVGNAVPPPLARRLALFIKHALRED